METIDLEAALRVQLEYETRAVLRLALAMTRRDQLLTSAAVVRPVVLHRQPLRAALLHEVKPCD